MTETDHNLLAWRASWCSPKGTGTFTVYARNSAEAVVDAERELREGQTLVKVELLGGALEQQRGRI